jgi:hypothetical protein
MSSSQGRLTTPTRLVPPECRCCPLEVIVLPFMIICLTPGFKRVPASHLVTPVTNILLFLQNIPSLSPVITASMPTLATMLVVETRPFAYENRCGKFVWHSKSTQQGCRINQHSMSQHLTSLLFARRTNSQHINSKHRSDTMLPMRIGRGTVHGPLACTGQTSLRSEPPTRCSDAGFSNFV